MLVFVDESGDPGFKFASGSSIFFIVVAAIFPDSFSADACDRSIEELRRTLRLPLRYEFHFSHCSDRVRREFFKKVVTDQFQYHGFVLNKPRLYGNRFNDQQGFYDFTVGLVCENAGPLLRDAIVVIDKCGDREFKQKLAKSLKARMTDGDGNCRLKKVRMESSHNNNLVQLADMLCGAVGRSFASTDANGGELRKIVSRREERVQFWPR